MYRTLALLVAVMLAGCTGMTRAPETGQGIESATGKQSTEGESPKFKNSTLQYLARRNLKPQPTRPLNVSSRCSHKDDIGTQTRLDLLVEDAEVKTFVAQISMKGYGTCRFDLSEFEQVAKLPQALLRNKKQANCLVRMWEQGPKVTIAFNSCPKSCDGHAFDYLWPIMVEAKSGQCY